MESFWSTLKLDTQIDIHLPHTRRAAELVIFGYLETFYNPTRRHSSLDYFSLWPSKNYTDKTSRVA